MNITKTKMACALRKNERTKKGLRSTKDENENGLRITKDEGRLAQYEGRRTKEGLRLTKDEERKHEGGWRAGVFVMQWFRNEEYIIQPRMARKTRNFICLQLLFLMAKKLEKNAKKLFCKQNLGLPHYSPSYNLADLIILANFAPFAVILDIKREYEGRLALYERRKTNKACALRKTKNENEGRLALYERRKTKEGLRFTKDEKRRKACALRRTKNENTKAVGGQGFL